MGGCWVGLGWVTVGRMGCMAFALGILETVIGLVIFSGLLESREEGCMMLWVYVGNRVEYR